jgi:hypothetical protein
MTEYAIQEILGVLLVFGAGALFGWWAKVWQLIRKENRHGF